MTVIRTMIPDRTGTLIIQAGFRNMETNQTSWDIGVQLAHEFMSDTAFNPRTDLLSAPYRTTTATSGNSKSLISTRQWRRDTSPQDRSANTSAQSKWPMKSTLKPPGTTRRKYGCWTPNFFHTRTWVSLLMKWREENRYPNLTITRNNTRSSWSGQPATVLEKRPKMGNLQLIDEITSQHKRTINRRNSC